MDLSEEEMRRGIRDSNRMHTMQVLVRERGLFFSNHNPAVLVLTDKGLFYGGSNDWNDRYLHIPFSKIIEAGLYGRSFTRSVRLVYEADAREKKVFFTPFTGEPAAPQLDVEGLEKLMDLIREIAGDMGVRVE